VVELILVVIIAVLLVWIAIIAYLIFKDHGTIEHVEMLRMYDSFQIFRPENEENPDLKSFDDRF
jgi:hypothetical protein